jgi:hypothetical protein
MRGLPWAFPRGKTVKLLARRQSTRAGAVVSVAGAGLGERGGDGFGAGLNLGAEGAQVLVEPIPRPARHEYVRCDFVFRLAFGGRLDLVAPRHGGCNSAGVSRLHE